MLSCCQLRSGSPCAKILRGPQHSPRSDHTLQATEMTTDQRVEIGSYLIGVIGGFPSNCPHCAEGTVTRPSFA
jgi:hypothetical protein